MLLGDHPPLRLASIHNAHKLNIRHPGQNPGMMLPQGPDADYSQFHSCHAAF